MMDSMQQGVLRLIYSAVSGEPAILPDGFDLEQAIPVIKKHQLGNLVYYGAVNCGLDTKTPVMRELFGITYKAMLVDERQRAELRRLTAAFDGAGIHYMPVKGVLMKELYPKPDMRLMGDADILIKMDQYDQIKTVISQLDYVFKNEADHQLVWDNPRLHLELHRRLVPDYNVDFARYYGDCWHLGKPSAENPSLYEMTKEDHMIFLFTHFAKHYRNGGIGVRHMLDLFVYRQAYPAMDQSYIAQELKKLQLYDFYVNIFDTLNVWFADGIANPKTELITDRIFESGAYGTSAGRTVFTAVTDKAQTGVSAKQLQRRSWIKVIFLPCSAMCITYPVLKKIPVLLPIMWVVRWIGILFKRPGSIAKHCQKVALLKEEKLDAWEINMRNVGLSFNFEENEQ